MSEQHVNLTADNKILSSESKKRCKLNDKGYTSLKSSIAGNSTIPCTDSICQTQV